MKHKLAAGGADPLDDIFDTDGNWRRAPAPWPEPVQALQQYELRQVLIDCIAALPPAQARAFSLRELDGLSGKEVCRTLQVTPDDLGVLLHCARMRLRQGLEDRWFRRVHA